MELPDGFKPRHVIGIIGLIIVGTLMFQGVIGAEMGLTALLGILAALGAFSYGIRSERKKSK